MYTHTHSHEEHPPIDITRCWTKKTKTNAHGKAQKKIYCLEIMSSARIGVGSGCGSHVVRLFAPHSRTLQHVVELGREQPHKKKTPVQLLFRSVRVYFCVHEFKLKTATVRGYAVICIFRLHPKTCPTKRNENRTRRYVETVLHAAHHPERHGYAGRHVRRPADGNRTAGGVFPRQSSRPDA